MGKKVGFTVWIGKELTERLDRLAQKVYGPPFTKLPVEAKRSTFVSMINAAIEFAANHHEEFAAWFLEWLEKEEREVIE